MALLALRQLPELPLQPQPQGWLLPALAPPALSLGASLLARAKPATSKDPEVVKAATKQVVAGAQERLLLPFLSRSDLLLFAPCSKSKQGALGARLLCQPSCLPRASALLSEARRRWLLVAPSLSLSQPKTKTPSSLAQRSSASAAALLRLAAPGRAAPSSCGSKGPAGEPRNPQSPTAPSQLLLTCSVVGEQLAAKSGGWQRSRSQPARPWRPPA